MVGARVPYLVGGFQVESLPENIRLKKPRQYGSTEIKMLNKKNIIGDNLIKDEQNLLFIVHQFTDKNISIQLDCNFKSKIVDVLSKQGFI